MTPSHVKPGRAVTFMKYLASIVSFIFPPKILICNKITFPASNSLNLPKLMINVLMRSFFKINSTLLLLFFAEGFLGSSKISNCNISSCLIFLSLTVDDPIVKKNQKKQKQKNTSATQSLRNGFLLSRKQKKNNFFSH